MLRNTTLRYQCQDQLEKINWLKPAIAIEQCLIWIVVLPLKCMNFYLITMSHTCYPNKWEKEAGRSGIQSYAWLRGKSEARLGYMIHESLPQKSTTKYKLLTSYHFNSHPITCTLTLSITQERTCKTCIFVSHSVTCCSSWKSSVNMVSKYCRQKKKEVLKRRLRHI